MIKFFSNIKKGELILAVFAFLVEKDPRKSSYKAESGTLWARCPTKCFVY